MYHVGVINQGYSENELRTYIDTLKSDIFLMEIITKEVLPNDKDIILLFADYSNIEMMNVCSMILQLRKKTDALIWVYKRNTEKTERVVYLQLGADLTLSDDCSPEEMQQLLLKTFKRKIKKESYRLSSDKPIDENNHFILNENNLSIVVDQKEISLTKKEYDLIYLLKSRSGEAFTYQEIYDSLWIFSSENHIYRVANIVFRIRGKLEKHGINPNCIRTVRSIGYALDAYLIGIEKSIV